MTDAADSEQRKLVLMLRTELAGLPFIWRFIALPADSDLVCLSFFVYKDKYAVFHCAVNINIYFGTFHKYRTTLQWS